MCKTGGTVVWDGPEFVYNESQSVVENKYLDTNRHQAALTHNTSYILDLYMDMCILYVTIIS